MELVRIGCAVLVTCCGLTLPLSAQDEKADDKPAKKTPPTHEVKAERFKIDLELEGVFESRETAEIALRPTIWSTLRVEWAVPHGTSVKKGDVLVRLETRKIEQQLVDLKYSLQLGELSVNLGRAELKTLESSVPLDMKAAERARQIAGEDLEYFLKVQRPRSEKTARFSLRSAEHGLEYAQEELKQLTKMYEADDLTEETEEIVLKRARHDVEYAEYALESSRVSTQRTLEVTLPRNEVDVREAAARAALELERARATLPERLTRKRLELEKLELEQQRNQEQYEKLAADLDLLVVRAPADGVVYYGRERRGKWSDLSSVESQLRPGGNLVANQVFMTIVNLKPLGVRVELAEEKLQHARLGIKGYAIPKSQPQLRLPASLAMVGPVPISSGNFDGQVGVDLGGDETIVPGMSCQVVLTAYDNPKVVTVPAKSVFTDDDDPRSSYVYVATADGHQRRVVQLGQRDEDRVEVKAGLNAGEKILLEKPDESDSP